MIVKKDDFKRKQFRGFSFLVGAVGERMMVALMQFKKGDKVSSHKHPNEQAGYCLLGKFKLIVDGKEYFIEKGDSYVILENNEHSYIFLEDSKMVEIFSPPRR